MEQSTTTDASGGGVQKPCHWGGGNDIIWCSTCGAEYAYAKGEVRPDCPLASAPPAPTPDAGSDLKEMSAAVWALLREWDTSPELPESLEQRLASFENAWRLFEDNARRSTPSPPPAEDLAGQGEPVAWVYEAWNTFDEHWFPIFASVEPAPHPHRRNIRALYAAPAPSRPADREEIARAIARHMAKVMGFVDERGKYWPRWTGLTDQILALRDAPRDGGDGWLPIGTAPRDGTPMWAYLYDSGICRVRYWSEQQIAEVEGGDPEQYKAGFYDLNDSSDEWRPKWWLPIDRLPAPPSPNAGDGTQDRQGGGR